MSVITIGIRELKAGLSDYLSRVRHEAETVMEWTQAESC